MGVTCDIHNVWCGSLVEYMSRLVKQHHNLHCSVITGIPMKVSCFMHVRSTRLSNLALKVLVISFSPFALNDHEWLEMAC